MESPILRSYACLPPISLPDANFPRESRLLGTAAAAPSACSCCSGAGKRVSSAPSQGWFSFSFILENLVALCQLWAQYQLPPVCPRCFCSGTFCIQAPAESHTLDCNPVIPSDGFREYSKPCMALWGRLFSLLWFCISLFHQPSVADLPLLGVTIDGDEGNDDYKLLRECQASCNISCQLCLMS